MIPLSQFLIPHSSFLINAKNLLAFSHGLDSTALFYLLREEGIDFDIALVNYGMREQAEEEEAAAAALAKIYGVRAHIVRAPKWERNFEAEARKFRYGFFESLIDRYGYDNLLTAHQLDDRLEWMLMRLIRGAGAVELAGMEAVTRRETAAGRSYRLIRPLLRQSKAQLRDYLLRRGATWFDDASNADPAYERNRLRSGLAGELLRGNEEGIRRSFDYLEADSRRLLEDFETLYRTKQLRIARLADPRARARAADRLLKELGYLLTAAERERISRGDPLVAGRRWAVEESESLLYIAPYLRGIPLPRSFRERCRKCGIPPKIRTYLYREGIVPESLPSVKTSGHSG
ncbi:tRNA lysidine(34) synthetase TilS [Nitratifractor sp.]|uniref:tRNA lysidine(34) synthetase TilS n=1 Tax=Nitratifractor sp. TaxID=2268144 RepID=UPI0025DE366E|nr:tRNA lysidine(34) synthetase TilS [Nitratifractor sp.]